MTSTLDKGYLCLDVIIFLYASEWGVGPAGVTRRSREVHGYGYRDLAGHAHIRPEYAVFVFCFVTEVVRSEVISMRFIEGGFWVL